MENLITEDEIKRLRAGARTITVENGFQQKIHVVIPMDLQSGYGVSLSIAHESSLNCRMEILSVGSRQGPPDPADAERIAKAVLGDGYTFVGSLLSRRMAHFYKVAGAAHESR